MCVAIVVCGHNYFVPTHHKCKTHYCEINMLIQSTHPNCKIHLCVINKLIIDCCSAGFYCSRSRPVRDSGCPNYKAGMLCKICNTAILPPAVTINLQPPPRPTEGRTTDLPINCYVPTATLMAARHFEIQHDHKILDNNNTNILLLIPYDIRKLKLSGPL